MLLRHAAVSLALALVAVVSAVLPAAADDLPPFEDTTGTSYETAVGALAEEHLVEGCASNEYCPDEVVTRGQFASIVAGVLDTDEDTYLDAASEVDHLISSDAEDEAGFIDVAGTTHEDAILQLDAAGVTDGCTDVRYCPDEPVTRAQAASFLDEVFDLPDTAVAAFDDTSGVHVEAIDRLAAAGIAAGCGEPLTAFCPDTEVLRSHLALFVARGLDYVERVELAPLEERRTRQAEIDAAREAAREAERQAQLEAERQAAEEEAERQAAAERAAQESQELAVWRSLAECESGMTQTAYNPAGPYYGYFQFDQRTWESVGMSGDPRNHSWDQQLAAAQRLQADRGWYPWPACASKLGLI